MRIAKRVEKAVAEEKVLTTDAKYLELKEFYAQMQREGVAVKRSYDLPPLDTVGHGIYSSLVPRTRSH